MRRDPTRRRLIPLIHPMRMQDSSSVCSVVGVSLPASRAAWLNAVYVVVGCLAMSLAAQVRVPIPGTDVPMTLQLLGVFLIGFALRPALAVAAMVLYLVCGTAGLPVFAGPGGLGGATGGYLLGFIPAVWLVSILGHRRHAGEGRLFVAGLCGGAIVFALGVGWRVGVFQGLGAGDASLGMAIATGAVPFAVKAIVELALATACAGCVSRLIHGRRKVAQSRYGSDQV